MMPSLTLGQRAPVPGLEVQPAPHHLSIQCCPALVWSLQQGSLKMGRVNVTAFLFLPVRLLVLLPCPILELVESLRIPLTHSQNGRREDF